MRCNIQMVEIKKGIHVVCKLPSYVPSQQRINVIVFSKSDWFAFYCVLKYILL